MDIQEIVLIKEYLEQFVNIMVLRKILYEQW